MVRAWGDHEMETASGTRALSPVALTIAERDFSSLARFLLGCSRVGHDLSVLGNPRPISALELRTWTLLENSGHVD